VIIIIIIYNNSWDCVKQDMKNIGLSQEEKSGNKCGRERGWGATG